jgi:hypothetical protein
MPGRRPTVDELAERTELCRSMLQRRVPKGTIKRAVRQRFGADIDHATIERYLTRAREALLTDLTRGRQTHRADALGFYESVLADSKAAFRDKIKAQERIDKLLGLEDKSNQPPLEVVLGQLPPAIADPLRGLLAAGVRPGGGGPSGPAEGGRNGGPAG